jgi:CDP-glucose 4,6-dehydratase
VLGLSRPEPVSHPDLWSQLSSHCSSFLADIRDAPAWSGLVRDFEPEVVLHLAAQPLVSYGYRNPGETFDTNVGGTVRLLEALDGSTALRALVVVTTDKVYDPRQVGPHREQDFVGGDDPYSASKAGVELVCRSWPSLAHRLVTARAGNVIGGGDWAPDRLLPDAVRAWTARKALVLRRPEAVRPWQHVLEPLRGYLLLAERVAAGDFSPDALNFGPDATDAAAVELVIAQAAEAWADGAEAPSWVCESTGMHEVEHLTIDSSLAEEQLGWKGVMHWQEAVAMTMRWYRDRATGAPSADLVDRDLDRYEALLREVSR